MGNQQLIGDEYDYDGVPTKPTASTSSDDNNNNNLHYESTPHKKTRKSSSSYRRKRAKSVRKERGYTSDAIIPTTISKKRYEEVIQIPTSSSTPQQETTTTTTDWWKRFNNDAIDPNSTDSIYLYKNSKYIDELLNDFNGISSLIADRIKNVNEEKESNVIHPRVLKLINDISIFDMGNIASHTLLQANEIQELSCLSMLSMTIDQSLEQRNHKNTIVFNVFELVSFYYDLFWVSYALNIKANTKKSDEWNAKKYSNFPHFIFHSLFYPPSKMAKQVNRSRINMREYVASVFFMHLCINMKTRYAMDNENEEYTIQLIFPQYILDGKKMTDNEDVIKNMMTSACILLYMGAPKEEIEQHGMKVITVDRELEKRFGDQTTKIVNEVMVDNMMCILKVLIQNHLTWINVFNVWSEFYEPFIFHNEENAYLSALNSNTNDIISQEIVYFKYEFPSKDEYEKAAPKIINSFSYSSKNVTSKFMIQKTEGGKLMEFEPNEKLPTFVNVSYHQGLGVIKTQFAQQLMCLMCFQYDVLNIKRFIGQWLVIKGNMMMSRYMKKEKRKYGFHISIYNEIKCSIVPFLMMNFRFFPSFDLLLTLYHGSRSRYISCHINFEYLANNFLNNNFLFDNHNKKLIINFTVDIKKIRQAILYNPSIATKKQRPPTREENIFIPFSWMENTEDRRSYAIAPHIKQDLDSKYKTSDKFTINNLKIGSFTRNDVVKNAAVVLSSEKISTIIVDRDAVYNNNIANSIVIESYNMYGTGILFDDAVDPNKFEIDTKETIMSNVKHAELLKGRDDVKHLFKSVPINMGICVNGFDVFTHELTQIKCINAFNISVIFDEKDFYNMIEQWSSLYIHWPLQTSKVLSYCTTPKI